MVSVYPICKLELCSHRIILFGSSAECLHIIYGYLSADHVTRMYITPLFYSKLNNLLDPFIRLSDNKRLFACYHSSRIITAHVN